MKPTIFSISQNLKEAENKKFVSVFSTESFGIAAQKIDGSHPFNHVNDQHDEVIYVVSGEMNMRVGGNRYELQAGDVFKVPKGIPHGDIEGKNAEILVLEGKE